MPLQCHYRIRDLNPESCIPILILTYPSLSIPFLSPIPSPILSPASASPAAAGSRRTSNPTTGHRAAPQRHCDSTDSSKARAARKSLRYGSPVFLDYCTSCGVARLASAMLATHLAQRSSTSFACISYHLSPIPCPILTHYPTCILSIITNNNININTSININVIINIIMTRLPHEPA